MCQGPSFVNPNKIAFLQKINLAPFLPRFLPPHVFRIAVRRLSVHNNGMVCGFSETTQVMLSAFAGAVVLSGVTLDLYLAFLLQRRRPPVALPASDVIRQRPFSAYQALHVLFVTLVFALPSLAGKPGSEPPSERSLILGPTLYALGAFLVTAICLRQTGSTIRAAFSSERQSAARALRQGLVYGLAAIPPVLLLSQLSNALAERLGFVPRLQEVFDWLSNDGYSWGMRGFMMFAAVCLAPVAEETLFRGILFPCCLKGRTFAGAALITGFYFALIHFHAPSLLPLLGLGVAFSAGYSATGSLLTPIVMHALFNAASLLFYLAGNG